MKTVAVIDLDQWISQFDAIESHDFIIAQLCRITQQYQQCLTVNNSIFSLTYKNRYASFGLEFSKLGIQLRPKDCIDPLSEFYDLVGQSLLGPHKRSSKVAVLRLMADKQAPDCAVIDEMVINHITHGHDYSRCLMSNPSHGSKLEIINFNVLHEAWQEALLPDDRLLITPYIVRQQQRLSLGTFPSPATAALHA